MAHVVTPKTVVFYADQKGREPFNEWLEGLRDTLGRKHYSQAAPGRNWKLRRP